MRLAVLQQALGAGWLGWVILLGACLSSRLQAAISPYTLVNYQFSGADAANYANPQPPEVISPNIIAGAMTRNTLVAVPATGSTLGNPAPGFSSSGWNTSGTVNENSDYYSFTISPKPGYRYTIKKIYFDESRSDFGPTNWEIRTLFNLASGAQHGSGSIPAANTWVTHEIDLSGNLGFVGRNDTTEIRIYGFNAGHELGTWRIDNVRVEGSDCVEVARCKNIVANLNAAGSVTVTPAMIYDPDVGSCSGTQFLINGAASKTFTCDNAGPNLVTLTVIDALGDVTTCIAQVTVVDPLPPTIAPLPPLNRSPDPGQCYATVFVSSLFAHTVSSIADNCVDSLTHSYSLGSTFNSATEISGSHQFTGTTAVTVRVTDPSGNFDDETFNVVVSGGAGPGISEPPQSATRCAGSGVTFSVTASGATGYQWRLNGGNISGATASSYTIASVNSGHAGSYDVVVFGGCGSTTSSTATLTVHALPTVTLGAFSGVCVNAAAFALSGGSPAGGTYSGPGVSGGVFNPAAAGVGTHVITYTYTDANGCTAAATRNLTVNALPPTPTITPLGSTTFCAGGSVTLRSSSTTGNQWFRDGALISGATARDYVANVGGDYRVRVTNSNGCSAESATTSVSVTALPAAGISPSGPVSICSGSSVTLTATGGGTYQWLRDGVNIAGATAPTHVASLAGTYSVRVTASGCTATSATATVSLRPIPTFTFSTTNPGCFGASTGQITITPTGGTAPHEFSKDGGLTWQDAPTFAGLPAGSYSLRVRDAFACVSGVQTATLSQPAALSFSHSGVNLVCFGATTGSLMVNASGGTAPYEYSRDGGTTWQTGNSFTGLGAGDYALRVRDAAGCVTDVQTATLTQPPAAVNFSAATVNPACFGAATGSITVIASGGTAPYQYSKDNGATWQGAVSFTGLVAGTYPLLARDSLGCVSAAQNVTLTQPDAAVGFSHLVENLVCFGADTGSITVTAVGGTGPYTYSKDGGLSWQAGNTFAGLVAGVYPVQVRDSLTCASAVQNVTVTQPARVTFSVEAVNPACFGGNTGSLTLTASGGTGSYEYSRDGGGTWQPGGSFTGLTASTYPLLARDSLGCVSAAQSVTLTQPAAPLIFAHTGTHPVCFAAATGSLMVNASGGTAPYEYSRDGGTTWQSGPAFTGLTAGEYPLRVRDAAGCLAPAQTATLTQPPAAVSFSHLAVNPACFGGSTGSLTLAASGGTGPYEYSRNGGTTWQAENTFTGLTAGEYTLRARDAAGCLSAIQNVTLAQPAAVNFSHAETHPACFGEPSGALTLHATGGAAPYEYSKDGGATWQLESSFPGLPAGTYQLRVRDSLGCASASRNVTLTQPAAAVSFTHETVNPACSSAAGGSITLHATGGTAPYQYSKDGGATWQSDPAFTGLNAAVYALRVRDLVGCLSSAQNVTLSQPDGLVAEAGEDKVLNCAVTSVVLGPAVRIDGADYTWEAPNDLFLFEPNPSVNVEGLYRLTVRRGACAATDTVLVTRDATPPAVSAGSPRTLTCAAPTAVLNGSSSTAGVNFNWSGPGIVSGGNTATPTVNAPGTYTLTVTNPVNGCAASASVAVALDTTPPHASAGADKLLTCTLISAALDGASTTSGATLRWTGPGGFSSAVARPAVTLPGVYTLTVTGPNGCINTDTAEVIAATTPPQVSAGSDKVIGCAETGVMLDGSSTTPGIAYRWTGPDGFTSDQPQPVVTAPGEYTLEVLLPATGCRATDTVTVTAETKLDGVAIATSGPVNFCAGGFVILTARPADAAGYLWSNGATTPAIRVMASGVFRVTVTNASGCAATSEPVEVTVRPLPAAAIEADGPTTFCAGGRVVLTANPANAAGYRWSNGDTNRSLTVTTRQNLRVTVTNEFGCVATSEVVSVFVNALPRPLVSADGPLTLCPGGRVTLTANPSGFTDYRWSNGGTNRSIVVTEPGVYHVTATNPLGCAGTSATVTVTASPPPAVSVTASGPTTFCAGGRVTLTANAPDGVEFLWNNGAATRAIDVTKSGSFSVTATSAAGCSATSEEVVVTVHPLPAMSIETSGLREFCAGGSVTLTANPPGLAGYRWSNGATTRSITVTEAGAYFVTGTSAAGCAAASTPVHVSVLSRPAVSIHASGPTTFCPGGKVTLTASAPGAAAFLWSNGATTPSIDVTESGSFSVTATSAAGCASTSAPTVVTARDVTPPVARCRALAVEVEFGGAVEITAGQIDNGSTDDCGIASLALSRTRFTSADLGAHEVTLTVTDRSGNTATCAATVTVAGKPPPAGVTITIDDATLSEADAAGRTMDFAVRLSAPSFETITVNFTLEDGTARSPEDYRFTTRPQIVRFAPGETNQAISVTIVADNLNEATEMFFVNLSNPIGGTLAKARATGTILDDDPPPTLTVADLTVTEGHDGTVAASVVARLSAPAGQAITVNYATADGTARAGMDYEAAAGTLTFAPGETLKPVFLQIRGDRLNEENETFTVALSAPVNVTLARATATVTILDDDPPPALSVADLAVNEGSGGESRFELTVRLSAPSGRPVRVRFATTDGSATAPADYLALSGDLVFQPGGAPALLASPAAPELRIALEASGPVLSWPDGGGLFDVQAALSVGGDDPWIRLADPVTQTGEWRFVKPVSSGVARFFRLVSALTFAPGETAKTVTLAVQGDTVHELDETFLVALTAPVHATLARGQAVITIRDDDPPPTLSVGDVSVIEGIAGETLVVVPVRLEGATALPASVKWTTADGTATAPSDYTAAGGTLEFAPGVTTQNILLTVHGDTENEGDENFRVRLSEAVNARIVRSEGVVTILSDDTVPLLFIADASAPEGSNAQIAVRLTTPAPVPVRVNFATADGTAFAGSDYLAVSGTLEFAPGETNKIIAVFIRTDFVTEGPETFTVTLTAPVGALLAKSTATVTIRGVGQNVPPVVTITGPQTDDAFLTGTSLGITADATDADGAISWVEFYANNRLLGIVTAPPYVAPFTDQGEGVYLLRAVAVDDRGANSESPAVLIRVRRELPTLRLAIVTPAPAPEATKIQAYLADLGLGSQIIPRGAVSATGLQSFQGVVWDTVGAAGGVTAGEVTLLAALRAANVPLYFAGENLAGAAAGLPATARDGWADLVRLQPAVGLGESRVSILGMTHPLIRGPFGRVDDFLLATAPEAAVRVGRDETLLARAGVADTVLALQDPPISSFRGVVQNLPVYGGTNVNALVQRERLFKNGVWWMLGRPAPVVNYDLAVSLQLDTAQPRVGQEMTYTVTVQQSGAGEARGLGLAFDLPAGLEFIGASTADGLVGVEGRRVSARLRRLSNGDLARVRVVVRPTAPGSLTVEAAVTGLIVRNAALTSSVSP